MFFGTAWVTLFKKMRPLSNKGVLFFLLPLAPGPKVDEGEEGFLRMELLLPTFLPLPGCGTYSLQQRMIFSKRKT